MQVRGEFSAAEPHAVEFTVKSAGSRLAQNQSNVAHDLKLSRPAK